MTAKEWLSRGWTINREIDALEEARRTAFERCTSTTRAVKERVHGTGSRHDHMAAYAALSEEIDNAVNRLMTTEREILQTVMQLENGIYRQVLAGRYIRFQTWSEIAQDLNYSNMQVYRIHEKALAAVQPIVGKKL